MTRRSDLNIEDAATTEGIPVAPSAGDDFAQARVPIERAFIDSHSSHQFLLCRPGNDHRFLRGGIVVSNSSYSRLSTTLVSPTGNHFGFEPSKTP